MPLCARSKDVSFASSIPSDIFNKGFEDVSCFTSTSPSFDNLNSNSSGYVMNLKIFCSRSSSISDLCLSDNNVDITSARTHAVL